MAPLALREYRLALAGRMLTLTGHAAQSVVLAIIVLDLTQTPSGWGTLLTVQAIPQVLLMLAGGVAIDRFRAGPVMIASNLLQALTLAALIPPLALGQLELWHLYTYAIVSGMGFAFYIPASQTLVPEIVPGEQVRSANALWILAFHLSRFLGPPLAAAAIAQVGHPITLGVTVASFVVGAAFLIPVHGAPIARGAARSTLEQVVEGIRAARTDAALWTVILLAAVYNFGAAGSIFVGLPSLAKLSLDAGDEGVGILFGATGAGALLGVLATGSLARLPRQVAVGALTNLGAGAGLIGASLASDLWSAAAFLVLAGAFQSAGGVIFLTFVQTRCRPELRGRVMALLSLSLFGLTPLAYGLGGLLGDAIGPRGILVAGGAVVALCGAIMLARRAIRDVP